MVRMIGNEPKYSRGCHPDFILLTFHRNLLLQTMKRRRQEEVEPIKQLEKGSDRVRRKEIEPPQLTSSK